MSDVTDLLEQLREGFLDDLPVRIQKIEDEIMSSEDSDVYDELFRMVHSLKGTAGSYDFHEITKIAHNMEDVMLTLMDKGEFGKPPTTTLLLKFIDILRETTDSLFATKSVATDLDEQLEALRSVVFKGNTNVLVVEPSKLYSSLIEQSLKKLAVNATFTNDGLPALNNLLFKKYDLLITSLECLHLNGDALTAALRVSRSFNRDIKVILITSRSQDKIEYKNHFDMILERKTIRDIDFCRVIETILNI